jgi:hypothetical protein
MRVQSDVADVRLDGQAREIEETTFSTLCWPGFAFDRDRVRELGVPAYCWTPEGVLWEYEDGSFYLTARGARGGRRRADETDAPREGWSHPEDCACAACRAEMR